MNQDFKYDVAFSFLAKDEALATELNDLLADRLATFLYSKRQEELAGKDGEEVFNAVFGTEARLVVIFYRSGWGETPWTRIEQTAIRNRAFHHGWDFTFVVPLDERPGVPDWIPRTQIWFDWPRWGSAGAAPIIERRAKELGSSSRAESVQDRAARLQRAMDAAAARTTLLKSTKGVTAANQEVDWLFAEVQRLVAEPALAQLNLSCKTAPGQFVPGKQLVVLGPRLSLNIGWQYDYSNTLDGSSLAASLWRGHPPFPGMMFFDEPKRYAERKFSFDVTAGGEYTWKEDGGRALNRSSFIEDILKFYLNQIDKFES